MGALMNFTIDWPEITATFFLVIGLALAVFSGNAFTLYTVCFLMGLVFGRMWSRLKISYGVPVFLLVMGFFLGYILGGWWADLRLITLTLLAGLLAGYWLHKKKIIRSL